MHESFKFHNLGQLILLAWTVSGYRFYNPVPMLNFSVCCVPVSPLRKEPSHTSEMVSQLLFGETCVSLEKTRDHWIRVRCLYDGYEGWCQEGHVMEVE